VTVFLSEAVKHRFTLRCGPNTMTVWSM